MKKLELQNFGVVEMDSKEMRETEGGFLAFLIFAVIVVASLFASKDYWVE